MIGDGLVSAEYDVHKRQRRILTPAFGVSHIRAITPHFWYKANQLTHHIAAEVDLQPKEGIDVMRWMNRVTLDIIGLAGIATYFHTIPITPLCCQYIDVRIRV
jgi:cytochrome P450